LSSDLNFAPVARLHSN